MSVNISCTLKATTIAAVAEHTLYNFIPINIAKFTLFSIALCNWYSINTSCV